MGSSIPSSRNCTFEVTYCREYPALGWSSPFVSASLFTVAHFWQPYNYPIIFLIQLPLVYIVYWKRNIYIAILMHCAGNTIGALLSLVSFLGSA